MKVPCIKAASILATMALGGAALASGEPGQQPRRSLLWPSTGAEGCVTPACTSPHHGAGCASLLPGYRRGVCLHVPSCRPLSYLSDDELNAMLTEVCYDRKNPPPRAIIEQIENMTHQVVRELQTRYNTTFAWHGTVGQPRHLTYSFVPDGLHIPSNPVVSGDPSGNSNLFAKLDSDFFVLGGRGVWVGMFDYCFNRWSQVTGLSYQRVDDDGAAWGTAGAAGQRGDIRIGGRRIDGEGGILGWNNFPNNGGDMLFDTTEISWALPLFTNPAYQRFQNVLYHEHGHGMGLLHVCPTNNSKLMEPYISLAFYGPQHDDFRGAQRLYGDAYESNDTPGTATNIGTIAVGQVLVPSALSNAGLNEYVPANVTLTSIDRTADQDFFRLSTAGSVAISVIATPIGYNYDTANQVSGNCLSGEFIDSARTALLVAEVIASNGTTVLGSGTAAATGSAASALAVTVPPGDFFVRVRASGTVNENQMYQLQIIAGALPPPNNDNCVPPVILTPGVVYTQTNIGATNGGSASCVSNSYRDVWFALVTECPGTMRISTCGSSFDTVLSVYNNEINCAALTQIACNDDACGTRSIVEFPVTVATGYRIRVASFSSTASGEGTINILAEYLPPANDACVNAQVVTDGFQSGNLGNCGATNEELASCVLGSSADTWFRFNATADELLTVTACSLNFDPILTIYTGGCGSLTEVACDDDAGESGSACALTGTALLTTPVTAGQSYWIRVASVQGNTGFYGLLVSTRLGNDLCPDAYAIGNGSYTGTTVGSDRNSSASCRSGDTSGDVFYRWTATCNGTLTVDTCHPTTNFDTVLSVYSGSCASLIEVGCNDDSACGHHPGASRVSVAVMDGQTYTIRVAGYQAATGNFGLNVNSTPAAPVNDSCGSPTIIPGTGTFTGSTSCASTDDTSAGCAQSLSKDVWFLFTPLCSGTVEFNTFGSSFDTVLRVYTGSCGGLSQVVCNDDTGAGVQSSVVFNAVGGTAYRICLTGYNSTRVGDYTLNAIFPPNNPCSGAAMLIQEGSTTFDTTCAAASGAATCGLSNSSPALWYRFTASCSGEQKLQTCGSSFDTVLSAYTGDCAMPVQAACNDDGGCPGIRDSTITFQALAGTPILVRVSGYNNLRGSGVISHSCARLCPADFNNSGAVSVQDIFDFLAAYFANVPAADFNNSGAISVQDIFDYLAAYFAGCA